LEGGKRGKGRDIKKKKKEKKGKIRGEKAVDRGKHLSRVRDPSPLKLLFHTEGERSSAGGGEGKGGKGKKRKRGEKRCPLGVLSSTLIGSAALSSKNRKGEERGEGEKGKEKKKKEERAELKVGNVRYSRVSLQKRGESFEEKKGKGEQAGNCAVFPFLFIRKGLNSGRKEKKGEGRGKRKKEDEGTSPTYYLKEFRDRGKRKGKRRRSVSSSFQSPRRRGGAVGKEEEGGGKGKEKKKRGRKEKRREQDACARFTSSFPSEER